MYIQYIHADKPGQLEEHRHFRCLLLFAVCSFVEMRIRSVNILLLNLCAHIHDEDKPGQLLEEHWRFRCLLLFAVCFLLLLSAAGRAFCC